MICYKDRAFCSVSHKCTDTSCSRNFSDAVRAQAVRWWGGEDVPVAISAFPACTTFRRLEGLDNEKTT
jgi:hypothetical protein